MALWQDRQAGNPGRYLITPELGGAAYYATLLLQDNPIVEGTPEVVDSFLKAATSLLYGFSDPTQATPDDVFNAIYNLYEANKALIDALRTDLTSETSARISGDDALGIRIDDLTTALNTLDAELRALVAAEAAARQADIAAVRSELNDVDIALNVRVDGVAADLTSEIARAKSVETGLQTQVTDNYNELDGRIALNATNIAQNYTSLDARVTTNANNIATNDASSRNRDTVLQTNIDAEHVDMVNRTNANSSAIATETATRIAEDTAIRGSISALDTRVTNEITGVTTLVGNERIRAVGEETRIEDKFDGLNTQALGLIAANATAIGDEASRAVAAEEALGIRIDGTEPAILAGDIAQYWRGDKTWADFAPEVLRTMLAGVTFTSSADITANDSILVAFGKLQRRMTLADAGLAAEVTNRTNSEITAFAIDNGTLVMMLTRGDSSTYTATIPIATDSNPGAIAASTYIQIENNTGSINAMRNGLWVRANLGIDPSQVALTNTWLTIMGGTDVPIGARVTNEDQNVPNGLDYFYTATSSGNSWVAKSIHDIPLFTNITTGTIIGSARLYDLSANPDGTGTVVGLAALAQRVLEAEQGKVDKTATIAIQGPDVTSPAVEIGTGATLTAALTDTGIAAGSYGESPRTISDGGEFKLINETVDSKGRLSNISEQTMTLTPSRSGVLTGLVITNTSAATATDSILVAIGKHEGRLNAYNTAINGKEPAIVGGTAAQYWNGVKAWIDFATSVRSSVLTGLVTTNTSAIAATDSVLIAFGKAQGHLALLDTQMAGKEPTIAPGGTSQYWSGTKVWRVFQDDVRASVLSGLSLTDVSDVVATDTVLAAFGKLQAQINRNDLATDGKENTILPGTVSQYWRGDKTWQTLNTAVIGSVLTGLVTGTNAAIAATDTILAAFGKAQAHLVALDTLVATKQAQLNGTGFVKVNGTTVSYDNSTYATTTALTNALANTHNGSALSYTDAVWYGTSSTAAATVQKDVSIPSITKLNIGQIIWVKPTATNSVAAASIKLNAFAAAPIRYKNAATTGNSGNFWTAGTVSAFAWDGQYWNFIGTDDNTTYLTLTTAQIIAGTDTTDRVVQAVNLKPGILGTTLTGLVLNNTAIAASDSILGAFGKLQAQMNAVKNLTPYSVGRYNGVLSPTPGAITTGIATSNITIAFGSIQNGMEIYDTNGTGGILSNYNASTNTANVTTIQRGLENIPVLLQANPNAFGVVAIYITTPGSGYVPGNTFTVNGVTGTIGSVTQTGGLTTGSLTWDLSADYPSDKAGTGFAVTSTPGNGAIATIVTAYAVGNDRVIGQLEGQTENDPLISSSRLRGFFQEQLPFGGAQIGDGSIWGRHLSGEVIQGSSGKGVSRDANGNFLIDVGSGGNTTQVQTTAASETKTLNHSFTTFFEGGSVEGTIDWGDGQTTPFMQVDPSTPLTAPHTYNAAGVYNVIVMPTFIPKQYNPVLNDATWEEISEAIRLNKVPTTWTVGSRKALVINGQVGNFTFSNYQTYCFIIGINHNASHEGNNRIHFQIGKTALSGGIDICLTDNSYDTAVSATGYFSMNSTNTNANGWNGSQIRQNIIGTSLTSGNTLLRAMPADLRAVMQTVTKYTNNVGQNDTQVAVTATTDYMSLLSEFEVFGTRTNANQYEQQYQQQYEYYRMGNSKVKYQQSATGTAAVWWLRSPYARTASNFVYVHTAGTVNGYSAYRSYGVAPSFYV